MTEKEDINTWINSVYTDEENNKNLTDLFLSNEEVKGSLELKWEEYPKLERVWYNHKLRIITNFDLKIAALLGQEEPKGVFLKTEVGVEVLKYTPIEERMAELFPGDEHNKTITSLDLTQKGLRGTLSLEDFENLEELIVNMDCPWGRKYANSNYITGLNFGDAANNLKKLTLINNPNEWDIGKLNNLTKLEELIIKGDSNYFAQWTGSLKKLEGLESLIKLDVSYNPNLKIGLESIKNLEEIEAKGTVYEKSLKSFNGDIQAWKLIFHPEKISEGKDEIIKQINENLIQTRQSLKELDKKQLTDTDLEKKVEILETRNRELLK